AARAVIPCLYWNAAEASSGLCEADRHVPILPRRIARKAPGNGVKDVLAPSADTPDGRRPYARVRTDAVPRREAVQESRGGPVRYVLAGHIPLAGEGIDHVGVRIQGFGDRLEMLRQIHVVIVERRRPDSVDRR